MKCPKCNNEDLVVYTEILLHYPLDKPFGGMPAITKKFIRQKTTTLMGAYREYMLTCPECGWIKFLGTPHWKTTAELLKAWKEFYEFIKRENPDLLYTKIDELYDETKEYLHNA